MLDIEEVGDEYASSIKLLVVGDPGAGKTRTASTWPNVLYADCEGRLLSVRDRKVKRSRVKTLAKLEALISAMDQSANVRAKTLGFPVDTLVIDTLDEVARMIIKERLEAEKKESMAQQDWGYLADTLRGIVRRLRNIEDLHVIFNVHMKSVDDQESERTYFKPQIQGSMGDELAAYVDIAVLLTARPMVDQTTNQRVLRRHFQTYPDASHTWIKDHSGSLPMEFPINFDDDYERMATLIYGDKAKAQADELAKIKADLADKPTAEPESSPEQEPEAPSTSPEPAAEESSEAATDQPAEPEPAQEDPDAVSPAESPAEPEASTGDTTPEPSAPAQEVVIPAEGPTEEPVDSETSVPEPDETVSLEKEQASSGVPEAGTESVEAPAEEPAAAAEGETVTIGKQTYQACCTVCSVKVSPLEQVELSNIRYHVTLCREHFAERKKATK